MGLAATDRLRQVRLRPHRQPGLLVTIDGNDRTGKSTLLNGLQTVLVDRGLEVVTTRQPTSEAREMQAFRTYLFEPQNRHQVDYRALLCLMIGDRLQHVHQVILPALADHKIVLCDRYIFTQMVTTRTRGHQDEDWMYQLYEHVVAPDIGIITDADEATAIRRISSRTVAHEAFHEVEHVQRNLQMFRDVADAFGLTAINTGTTGVDAARDSVVQMVDDLLRSRADLATEASANDRA